MRKVIICIVMTLLLSTVGVGIIMAQKGMRTLIGIDGVLPEEPYRSKWALLIGINKYPNLPVKYQLQYAENDVKELKKVLLEQYQFPESNIITLINEQATYQGIKEKFAQLSDTNKVDPNDCVLIYFSGHGQTVPKPRGGDMGFLIPYDAKVDMNNVSSPSSYYATCLGMDELKRLASMIPAKHVMFLVDACYSGLTVANRGGLQTSIPGYLKKVASVSVQQVITAGGKGDMSSESPEWGHGAFTYKLLEALRTGVADGNDDGVTTGMELAAHLKNVVPNISPNQTPTYGYFDGEGEFLFLQMMNTGLIPAPPSGSGFSLDDLKNEADRLETIEKVKKAWASNLTDMKKAYNNVMAYGGRNVLSNLKYGEWQGFIDSFKEDNPYSQEDNSMRAEARKQLDYWKEAERLEAIEKVKKAWASNLTDMKKAYNEVKAIESRDITSDLKVAAWQRFVDSFKEDNPYSQEDDTMRQQARTLLDYWRNITEIDTSISTIIGKDDAPQVLIPAGDFQMGNNDGKANEKPVHTVYLDAFYMDVYEVTNEQYRKFMKATGYKAPAYWNDSNYNASKQPVVGINWEDAKAYAKWAIKRLPTEAEWEKAARGGLVGKRYPLGDTLTHDDANYIGTDEKDIWKYTSPVGSFAPNGYELYDMAGNVWEWCADLYNKDYYSKSPKPNPTGPSLGEWRVLRGGSWYLDVNYSLVSYRAYSFNPTYFYDSVGFRCVQDVPMNYPSTSDIIRQKQP
jgi:formylglycine-generating enzyme